MLVILASVASSLSFPESMNKTSYDRWLASPKLSYSSSRTFTLVSIHSDFERVPDKVIFQIIQRELVLLESDILNQAVLRQFSNGSQSGNNSQLLRRKQTLAPA